MLFKVLSGRHVGSNGRTYAVGDIIKTDVNMVEKFPNKFARAIEEELAGDAKSSAPPSIASKPEEAAKNDVTGEFPSAASNGFKILQDSKGYWVFDTDAPEEPQNKKPLKAAKVVPFMDSFFED